MFTAILFLASVSGVARLERARVQGFQKGSLPSSPHGFVRAPNCDGPECTARFAHYTATPLASAVVFFVLLMLNSVSFSRVFMGFMLNLLPLA